MLPNYQIFGLLEGGGNRYVLVVELKGDLFLLVVDFGVLVITSYILQDEVITTQNAYCEAH